VCSALGFSIARYAGGAASLKFLEIVHQLGELFLEAVPTVVIVFLFYLFMRWSFFGPITKVMAERKARVEGARREAEGLREQAAEKKRADEAALRAARATIFTEHEAVRRVALDERATVIQEARTRANGEVLEAKKRIATEIRSARAELETSGSQLAEQIVQAILDSEPHDLHPAGGAQ
jgi:F0F1-type ATP synthase membrane subunit b/b'